MAGLGFARVSPVDQGCAISGGSTLVRPTESVCPNIATGTEGPCWVASHHQTRLEPVEATAVHSERGAGHEGGIIRRQKGDRGRNVVGLTHHTRVDLLGP